MHILGFNTKKRKSTVSKYFFFHNKNYFSFGNAERTSLKDSTHSNTKAVNGDRETQSVSYYTYCETCISLIRHDRGHSCAVMSNEKDVLLP